MNYFFKSKITEENNTNKIKIIKLLTKSKIS